MSRKIKEAVVWIRITYRDTVAAKARVLKAADALFRKADVVSRGDFTEEEVIAMVKAALEKAALMPRGQQAQAPAPSQSAGRAVRPTGAEDPLAGEEFEE